MLALALGFALVFNGQERAVQSGVVQNTANVAFGERLIIRRDNEGIVAVEARRVGATAAIPLTPQGARSATNPLVQTRAGTVAFGLGGEASFGSILRVENATDQPIAYTAYIVRFVNGAAQPPARSNVCTVPAGMASFEHWPEPVVQVVIGNARTADSDAVVCEPGSVAE